MNIEFIKTPYTTSPSMTRNNGEVFIRSPRKFYISEKQKELDTWGKSLYGTTEIAKDQGLVSKLAEFCGFKDTNDIKEVALQLEEDIAIIHQGILSSICFCFPSNWRPSERLGLSLSGLHDPVADGDQLIKASPRISNLMQKQSILRWIWTVTTSPSLSNYPDYKRLELTGIDSLFLRVETQTTTPLTEESSAFFVRIDIRPLKEVGSKKILESINSMSEDVLEYKNLKEIKNFLNESNQWFN